MQNLKRTQAIIIKRTNYSEADRILQLITPEGLVSAIAKGARKQKSKLAAGIELFSLSDVVLAGSKTKSGLMRLQSVRLIEPFSGILAHYERLELAALIVRQIRRHIQDIDDQVWFEVAHQCLLALNDPQVSLVLIQAWFNLQLSALTGQAINLSIDSQGKPLSPDCRYNYDGLNNVFVHTPGGQITSDHLKALRLLSRVKLTKLTKVTGLDEVLPPVLTISANFIH